MKPCPVRPETGPVGSSDDPHEFIKRQIDYLQGQITWLESREIFTEEVFIAKEYVLETVRIGDLYKTNKILSPANFFIFEMDDLIQCLRRLIDSHQ